MGRECRERTAFTPSAYLQGPHNRASAAEVGTASAMARAACGRACAKRRDECEHESEQAKPSLLRSGVAALPRPARLARPSHPHARTLGESSLTTDVSLLT